MHSKRFFYVWVGLSLTVIIILTGCGSFIETVRATNALEAIQPSYEARTVVEGPPVIEVRSNTCWDGNVNGASVERCGVQLFELTERC